MGCLRVLALIGGAILLLPGVCFLAISGRGPDPLPAGPYIGLLLLLIAGGLFWLAFRRKAPKEDGLPSDEGPKSEG